jgi:hypothetical protein
MDPTVATVTHDIPDHSLVATVAFSPRVSVPGNLLSQSNRSGFILGFSVSAIADSERNAKCCFVLLCPRKSLEGLLLQESRLRSMSFVYKFDTQKQLITRQRHSFTDQCPEANLCHCGQLTKLSCDCNFRI